MQMTLVDPDKLAENPDLCHSTSSLVGNPDAAYFDVELYRHGCREATRYSSIPSSWGRPGHALDKQGRLGWMRATD